MTFFFPNRSSSDDDALDHQLNQWATGSNTDPTSDEAADSLEFHRWADNTRRSDPAARGPAAGTWNRVLRNSAQESSKRSSAMSSSTLTAQSPGFTRVPAESFRQRTSRYATFAATIALVLAIAAGGWLTMSQMPGGSGDGRFAALQGTPEVAVSQTCDVTPLTVDEVIAIVENPLSAIDSGWWATPAPQDDSSQSNAPQNQELLEVPNIQSQYSIGSGQAQPNGSLGSLSVPDEDTFAEVFDESNRVLNCLTGDATMGQIWAMMEPVAIQNQILGNYPVYRDRESVRTYVEERIDQPSGMEYDYLKNQDDIIISSNPRRGDARIRTTQGISDGWMDYDAVMYIGWQGTDMDGNVVFADDWAGTTVDGATDRSNGTSLVLVHSESTGRWYYVGLYGLRG